MAHPRLTLILLFIIFSSVKTLGQKTSWNTANWISPSTEQDTALRSCPVFKKIFQLKKTVSSATMLISAHGMYEAVINGGRVGTDYFTPGWTSYDKRIQYQRYDISGQIKKGNNTLLVTVGEGWYRGAFGGFMARDNYGSDASLICQIDILFSDGSHQHIETDSSWQVSTGQIIHSDIYGGEIYDSRIQTYVWIPVKIGDYSKDILVEDGGVPVGRHETFKPLKVLKTSKGETVIDFGQNMAGWVRFNAVGNPGDTIRMQHAEILDKNGDFYTGNLRDAKATDVYILNGNGQQTFEPHFSWHGFRYVKVEGTNVKPEDFTAVALYSKMAPAGSFSCSNPAINQLQNNITWSMRSNFVDIPTDCPQRSERLGWTGDAQVFFRTAGFNFDVNKFYTKWLQDLKADQRDNGSVPNIIPNLYRNLKPPRKNGVAGWGDAATIVPWGIYTVYGDSAILDGQYNSMKAWVDYITANSQNDLWSAAGYGDWLAPGDSTSLPFIDQCYWAHSAEILANSAAILGKQADAKIYKELLSRIKSAFAGRYVATDGSLITDTQTAYAMALEFGMLPDSLKKIAAERLAGLVARNNYHLATGFLGTPLLLHALSNNGHTDIAYKLLLQETFPSWLYPIKMGATTIWEKWDAIKPDGTVQATSFNHYSYGAVGDWLYRVVAGIDAASPGYKRIIIDPHPGGGLTWVRASYLCQYGKIISEWKVVGKKIIINVEIPAGTEATIYVPGKNHVEVKSGKYMFEGILIQ